MPRATVWIRNEDWEQWQAIDKKAEWLHEHLNVVWKVTPAKFGKLSDLGNVQEFEYTKDASNFARPIDDPKYEPMDS